MTQDVYNGGAAKISGTTVLNRRSARMLCAHAAASVKLPDPAGWLAGRQFYLVNNSGGDIDITDKDDAAVATIPTATFATIILLGSGSWVVKQETLGTAKTFSSTRAGLISAVTNAACEEALAEVAPACPVDGGDYPDRVYTVTGTNLAGDYSVSWDGSQYSGTGITIVCSDRSWTVTITVGGESAVWITPNTSGGLSCNPADYTLISTGGGLTGTPVLSAIDCSPAVDCDNLNTLSGNSISAGDVNTVWGPSAGLNDSCNLAAQAQATAMVSGTDGSRFWWYLPNVPSSAGWWCESCYPGGQAYWTLSYTTDVYDNLGALVGQDVRVWKKMTGQSPLGTYSYDAAASTVLCAGITSSPTIVVTEIVP